MRAIGDIPVLYPDIVDDVGEATQAKRRGRASIISHRTPAFTPAGRHASLTAIHDPLHARLALDEGDRKLAHLYLSRRQLGYEPDETHWGRPGAGGENLYAAHLKGTGSPRRSCTSPVCARRAELGAQAPARIRNRGPDPVGGQSH
ncbi:cobaltochelatase subunit CobN [Zoogloea sp.]|uniref:cobaltochelatase subunit CobN n=1 Tax=Zoogloea sp. TaxID=49181 RepID=UPI0035B49763